MSSQPGFARLMLLLLTALLASADAAPERSAFRGEETAAGRSARIAQLLESGRTVDGLDAARKAAADAPNNALIRRRLAQAQLCEALRLDSELDPLADGEEWALGLEKAVDWVRQSGTPQNGDNPERLKERRQEAAAAAQLLSAASSERIRQFEQSAHARLAAGGPLLEKRTRALQSALASLTEARRLGDTSTDGELTRLWAEATLLLWRVDERTLSMPAYPIAGMAGLTPEGLAREAAALARQRIADPSALAGAADLIEVAAALSDRKPLGYHAASDLDRVPGLPIAPPPPPPPPPGGGAPGLSPPLLSAAAAAPPADPVGDAWADVGRLYARAAEQDRNHTLPYLPLRVYLLRLPGEPALADTLLPELRRRDPRNGAVALEQARVEFLRAHNELSGVAQALEAARLPEFRRSFFVAFPGPLRPALSLQRRLRDIPVQAWPGYEGLFAGIEGMDQNAVAPSAFELRRLRLDLGLRMAGAPDYADRLQGMRAAGRALRQLLANADLPPGRRSRLAQDRIELQKAEQTLPRLRVRLVLTPNGLRTIEGYADPAEDVPTPGPRLVIHSPGNFSFSVPAASPRK